MPLAVLICWRESSAGSLSTLIDWSTSCMRKSWESWGCSAWRRLRRIFMCINTCREGEKRMGPGSKGAQTQTQEDPSEHQEPVFQWEDDWALAQSAQRICEVSLLGDVKNLSRCDPRQSTQEGGWIRWPPDVPSNFNLSVVLFMWFTKVKKELKEKYIRHNKL